MEYFSVLVSVTTILVLVQISTGAGLDQAFLVWLAMVLSFPFTVLGLTAITSRLVPARERKRR